MRMDDFWCSPVLLKPGQADEARATVAKRELIQVPKTMSERLRPRVRWNSCTRDSQWTLTRHLACPTDLVVLDVEYCDIARGGKSLCLLLDEDAVMRMGEAWIPARNDQDSQSSGQSRLLG